MNNLLIFLTTELRPVFPESSKIFIKIGNLEITWYAVIILSGAIVCALFGYFHYLKRLGVDADTVSEGLAIGLLCGILGARLYYVAFSGYHYNSFWEVINPREGGLAIHGAVISTMIFIPIYCKIKHIDLITTLEIALPIFMFGQVVGRWGNFVNQEAFGSLIKYPGFISNEIPLDDNALIAQRAFLKKLLIPDFIIDRMYIDYSSASGFTVSGYYHPTFLYESVLNLIGMTAYMTIRKFWKKILVGDGVSFYLIWYGIVRIFIESLRTDPLLLGNTNIKMAWVTSGIFIFIGLVLAIGRRIFKYRMESCYDALYKEGATIILNNKVDENFVD